MESKPERRRLARTHVPGPLRYRREARPLRDDACARPGEMRTLSGDGLSFVTSEALRVGEDLSVEIRGVGARAPILRGRLRVLRSEPRDGRYLVAGAFLR